MHMLVGMQRTPLERIREHHSTHALEEAAVVEPGPVALQVRDHLLFLPLHFSSIVKTMIVKMMMMMKAIMRTAG